MIDPLITPGFSNMAFPGRPGDSGTDPVQALFEELRQKAEQARAQAMQTNPNVGPIDYDGLYRAAQNIAAGRDPKQVQAEASQHMFQGQPVSRGERRAGMFSALGDAGAALLAGAGSGDPAGSLAAAAQAFSGRYGQEMSDTLARRRQAQEDELSRRLTESELQSQEERRRYTREDREAAVSEDAAKLDAMRGLADEIKAIAGADSPEGKRADALLRGGPALYEDLQDLNSKMVEKSQEGKRFETELEQRRRIAEQDWNSPEAKWERSIREREVAVQEAAHEAGLSEKEIARMTGDTADRIYAGILKQHESPVGSGYEPGFDPIAARRQAVELAVMEVEGRVRYQQGQPPSDGTLLRAIEIAKESGATYDEMVRELVAGGPGVIGVSEEKARSLLQQAGVEEEQAGPPEPGPPPPRRRTPPPPERDSFLMDVFHGLGSSLGETFRENMTTAGEAIASSTPGIPDIPTLDELDKMSPREIAEWHRRRRGRRRF